jgi:hypothetical protein
VVALHDVADLVPEHARELRLAVEHLVEPARDQHVAARRGEGIDRGGVEHAEMPRQVGALGLHRDPAPDAVDVGLQLGVRHQGRRAQRAAGHLAADRDLLGLVEAGGGGPQVPAHVEDAAEINRCGRRVPGSSGHQRGGDPVLEGASHFMASMYSTLAGARPEPRAFSSAACLVAA